MFNTQRAITPKVGKPQLLFMCFAHRLIVLYIGVKFCENITKVSELWSGHEYMVEMAMFNVQRYTNQSYGSCVLHIISQCFTVV